MVTEINSNPSNDSFDLLLSNLKLKTGDILLFSGTNVLSYFIQIFTRSKWSHVALIFCSGDEKIFCFEADVDSIGDFLHKKGIGVRMVPIEEKLKSYPGEIYIRKLEDLSVEDYKMVQEQILSFNLLVQNKPYEQSFIEFIRAAYDGPFGENPKENLSSLFCSELVAAAYQHSGLLLKHPPGLPSNEYTPVDFTRTTFKLLKGGLSEIIPIKLMAKSFDKSKSKKLADESAFV